MARERWPKARRSSGANQRALRSVSGDFLVLLVILTTPERPIGVISHAVRRGQVPAYAWYWPRGCEIGTPEHFRPGFRSVLEPGTRTDHVRAEARLRLNQGLRKPRDSAQSLQLAVDESTAAQGKRPWR